MDPSHGRRCRSVVWVSYSLGEARSKLPYMKAISRGVVIVHWLLRPVVECVEAKRPGWLMARAMPRGIGGHEEELGLAEAYPWFFVSRRAVSYTHLTLPTILLV